MSGECQVNVKSQSELDIGGRETCFASRDFGFRILHFWGLLGFGLPGSHIQHKLGKLIQHSLFYVSMIN